jgi:hypothetical protein
MSLSWLAGLFRLRDVYRCLVVRDGRQRVLVPFLPLTGKRWEPAMHHAMLDTWHLPYDDRCFLLSATFTKPRDAVARETFFGTFTERLHISALAFHGICV